MTVEVSWLPINRAASANQNVTLDISRKKPKWGLHVTGPTNQSVATEQKTGFRGENLGNGTRAFTTGQGSYSQTRQFTLIWTPDSESNHRALSLSTRRSKAPGPEGGGRGLERSALPSLRQLSTMSYRPQSHSAVLPSVLTAESVYISEPKKDQH